MDDAFKLDFSPAAASGLLRSTELAPLFGVTHPMVVYYLSGKNQPRGYRYTRAKRVLRVLELLLEKGVLPVSPELTKEERRQLVERIAYHANVPI